MDAIVSGEFEINTYTMNDQGSGAAEERIDVVVNEENEISVCNLGTPKRKHSPEEFDVDTPRSKMKKLEQFSSSPELRSGMIINKPPRAGDNLSIPGIDNLQPGTPTTKPSSFSWLLRHQKSSVLEAPRERKRRYTVVGTPRRKKQGIDLSRQRSISEMLGSKGKVNCVEEVAHMVENKNEKEDKVEEEY